MKAAQRQLTLFWQIYRRKKLPMIKGIHNTKVHKDCPFDIETLDGFRNDLLNVATANGCRMPLLNFL